MDIISSDVLFSGLMGFFGGLVTIPINAIIVYFLKRDELSYSHKLDVIAKQRELLLQHKLEVQRKDKDSTIYELRNRLEQVETRLKHE